MVFIVVGYPEKDLARRFRLSRLLLQLDIGNLEPAADGILADLGPCVSA